MTLIIEHAEGQLKTLLEALERGEEVKVELEGRTFTAVPEVKAKRNMVGSLPGWKMSEDFDAPLEDMREYME